MAMWSPSFIYVHEGRKLIFKRTGGIFDISIIDMILHTTSRSIF